MIFPIAHSWLPEQLNYNALIPEKNLLSKIWSNYNSANNLIQYGGKGDNCNSYLLLAENSWTMVNWNEEIEKEFILGKWIYNELETHNHVCILPVTSSWHMGSGVSVPTE